MFKLNKILLTSLLALGLIVVSNASVNALSIGGWCCFDFSFGSVIIDTELDAKGVPNPEKKDQILSTDAVFAGTVACVNPAGNAAPAEGEPFSQRTGTLTPITSQQITKNKGEAKVEVQYVVDEECIKENWQTVEQSLRVETATIFAQWFICSGDDETPCTDENGNITFKKLAAQKSFACAWQDTDGDGEPNLPARDPETDVVNYLEDENGDAIEFECVETSVVIPGA